MNDNSKYDPEDFGDAELYLDADGNIIDKDEAEAITRIAELEKENSEMEARIAVMTRHEELAAQLQEREKPQETQMPSSPQNYVAGTAPVHQPVLSYPQNINVNIQQPAPRGSFIGGFFRFVFGFIFWSIAFTIIFGVIGAMLN